MLSAQLKLRIQKKAQKSALENVLALDRESSDLIVLCVSQVCFAPLDTPPANEAHDAIEEIELTDGWHSIWATVDERLASLVRTGEKICVGTKLAIANATLVQVSKSEFGLSLDEKHSEPRTVRLQLVANSTRRARSDAKLGHHQRLRALRIPLWSVTAFGGVVSEVLAIVSRCYPFMYLEKAATEGGRSVIRTEADEECEARKHAEQYERLLEEAQPRLLEEARVEALQGAGQLVRLYHASSGGDSFIEGLTPERRAKLKKQNDAFREAWRALHARAVSRFKQHEPLLQRMTRRLMRVQLLPCGGNSERRHVTGPVSLTWWGPCEGIAHELQQEGAVVLIRNAKVSEHRRVISLSNMRSTALLPRPKGPASLCTGFVARRSTTLAETRRLLRERPTTAERNTIEFDLAAIVLSAASRQDDAVTLEDETGTILRVQPTDPAGKVRFEGMRAAHSGTAAVVSKPSASGIFAARVGEVWCFQNARLRVVNHEGFSGGPTPAYADPVLVGRAPPDVLLWTDELSMFPAHVPAGKAPHLAERALALRNWRIATAAAPAPTPRATSSVSVPTRAKPLAAALSRAPAAAPHTVSRATSSAVSVRTPTPAVALMEGDTTTTDDGTPANRSNLLLSTSAAEAVATTIAMDEHVMLLDDSDVGMSIAGAVTHEAAHEQGGNTSGPAETELSSALATTLPRASSTTMPVHPDEIATHEAATEVSSKSTLAPAVVAGAAATCVEATLSRVVGFAPGSAAGASSPPRLACIQLAVVPGGRLVEGQLCRHDAQAPKLLPSLDHTTSSGSPLART